MEHPQILPERKRAHFPWLMGRNSQCASICNMERGMGARSKMKKGSINVLTTR